MDQEKNKELNDEFEKEEIKNPEEDKEEHIETTTEKDLEEKEETTTSEEVKDEEAEKSSEEEKTTDNNAETENENQEFETVPKEPAFEEVEEKKKKKRTDSYFDGSLIELIGYHLLSMIITAFTLGIGRPWGECLVMGYKINHTVYNGKRLKFEGKGANYFVQKFKWIFFTIITLGIYAFWIPINKIKWQVKNTHFEDEEFITGDSYFDGRLIQLIGINILRRLIIIVSFGLLYPFAHCMMIRWTAKHTIINRKKIKFDGSALDLFAHFLLWMFLTIITFGIYGLWLGINYMKWQTKNTHIKIKDEVEEKKNNNEMIVSIAIVSIVFIIGAIIVGSLLANFRTVPNTEAEANIRATITNAQNEFANKQYTDEEAEKWKTSNKAIPINSIKKLNLESLNTFDKNGGFGIFYYDTYYDRYDESTNTTSRQVELVLKYKNMVCLTTMNNKPENNTNNQVECKTFSEYVNLAKVFLQLNPITAVNEGKVRTNNEQGTEMYNNIRNSYNN